MQAQLQLSVVSGRVLGPEDLRDPGTLGRIAETLQRVHAGPAIPGTFSAFRTVEAYRQVALRHGVALPPALDGGLAPARRVEAVLPAVPAVPCHNDLLAANFVDEGARLRLLDWEYAAMGDPLLRPRQPGGERRAGAGRGAAARRGLRRRGLRRLPYGVPRARETLTARPPGV